jgi:hypothetical protein
MRPDTRLKTPPIPTVDPTDSVLYDEGNAASTLTATEDRRVMVSAFIDVAGTIFHDVYLPKGDGTYSSTARAGNGAGDAITANTVIHKDYKLLPGRNVIRIHTTTAPTSVWEVGAKVVPDRALGT